MSLQDAAEQVEKLQASLDEYVRTRYSEWMSEIADLDPQKVVDLLTTPVLARTASVTSSLEPSASEDKTKPGKTARGKATSTQAMPFLRSNFDKRLLAVLSEVHGWEKFEGKFLIPFYASDLLHTHGENLRVLRRYVLLICNDYNTIIASLDEVEARLFSDVVRRLDRKVTPGLGKITWMTKNVKDLYIKEVRKCCAEVWAVVQAFKNDRASVGRLIDTMRSTLLVDIERNYVHEEGVFEDRQSKHRAKVRTVLSALHKQMVEAMGRMYQIFKPVSFSNDVMTLVSCPFNNLLCCRILSLCKKRGRVLFAILIDE
jgi:dynein heavy chain